MKPGGRNGAVQPSKRSNNTASKMMRRGEDFELISCFPLPQDEVWLSWASPRCDLLDGGMTDGTVRNRCEIEIEIPSRRKARVLGGVRRDAMLIRAERSHEDS